MIRSPLAATVIVALSVLAGCANPEPVNPTFMVTFPEARAAIREMKGDRRPLPRPLVIVGGYLDPNVSPTYLKMQFARFTEDERIIRVVVGFHTDFEQCRQKLIAAVDEAFPTDDAEQTVEVDVIGASLGGLVARYAAAPSRDPAQQRRLRVARMFTMSSPHSGAVLAKTGALVQLHVDLRPGSDLMQHLAKTDAEAKYELYAYARLNDGLVGERYSARPGENPLWLAPPGIEGGHAGCWYDDRIVADIARRLRGEKPFSQSPGAALPAESDEATERRSDEGEG